MASTFTAAAASLAVAVLAATSAAGAGPCSSDTFSIERTAVTVTVCTVAPRHAPADRSKAKTTLPTGTVQETLSAKGREPIVRSTSYTRLASAGTARTIDDVPLGTLGIKKTLHLTLAIADGTARLEHALLSPDAVVLK